MMFSDGRRLDCRRQDACANAPCGCNSVLLKCGFQNMVHTRSCCMSRPPRLVDDSAWLRLANLLPTQKWDVRCTRCGILWQHHTKTISAVKIHIRITIKFRYMPWNTCRRLWGYRLGVCTLQATAIWARAVPDLFFPIRPEPDFAGFGMTNPAGAGAGFSNW